MFVKNSYCFKFELKKRWNVKMNDEKVKAPRRPQADRGAEPPHSGKALRSKSVRLRKYGSVYKKYVTTEKSTKSKKPIRPTPPKRRHRREIESERRETREPREEKESEKKQTSSRKLNDYQKFVKKESRKEKYNHMKGSERLNAIAAEWENFKKKKKEKFKESYINT